MISKLLVYQVAYSPYINYLFVNRILFISGYINREKMIEYLNTSSSRTLKTLNNKAFINQYIRIFFISIPKHLFQHCRKEQFLQPGCNTTYRLFT